MSCCDYGCTNGPGCAAHTEPESALTCARASGGATEVGNVWFAEPEPVRLTTCESIAIYGFITIASIASVALIAGAAGWVYQTIFN